MNKWQRIHYMPNLPLGPEGEKVTACQGHRHLSKEAAKAGMVLVKNDHQVLPLKKGSKIALFGKGTFDYVKGGGGSGDVTVAYTRNLYDGFQSTDGHVKVYEALADYYRTYVAGAYDEGKLPGLIAEPAVPENLLKGAAHYTDTAVVSICRFSGEGWDRKSNKEQKEIHAEPWVQETAALSNGLFTEGDFYLSQEERAMVEAVKAHFNQVIIVLNVGGMVDSEWFAHDDQIDSVLMAWQGGMEGGTAAAELLCGIGNPSGKLVDTFAKALTDYPSTYNYHESKTYIDYTDDIYVGYRYFETIPGASQKVNYPFGYGLSYTQFSWSPLESQVLEDSIRVSLQITNVGDMSGKEVLQLYVMAPQGLLGKPAKSLLAFQKTRLLAIGESQTMTFQVAKSALASYDDLGQIQKSAYVLEAGTYQFFIGTSVREGQVLDLQYTLEANTVVQQLSAQLVPSGLSKRMLADGSYETLATKMTKGPDEGILDIEGTEMLEGGIPQNRFRPIYEPLTHQVITLIDVYEGKHSLDDFVAQLSDEEVAHLLGGQVNAGVANTYGFGNLPEYGVPNAMTADGPAGLRIQKECGVNTTAWPCATLLGCTWDTDLVTSIGVAGAKEVKENNIGIWLTPALNIHRSPLCGRNFEYYSEDPLVAGKLSAAMVRGIQSMGIAATPKHFAFNNKETNRKNSDSRVSERAAREIYLKGFEIVVKESDPWCLMSSYNIVNGQRASANRDLLEHILRDEWGFNGAVTTDWWTYGEHYMEVKAGNDIKMACGYPDRLLDALKKGGLSREEMVISAKRVLTLIMKLD